MADAPAAWNRIPSWPPVSHPMSQSGGTLGA
jgi:hypothetical protein